MKKHFFLILAILAMPTIAAAVPVQWLPQAVVFGVTRTAAYTNITCSAKTIILPGSVGSLYNLSSLDITNESNTPVIAYLYDSASGAIRAAYALSAFGGVAKFFIPALAQQNAAGWSIKLSVDGVSVHINAIGIKER